MNEPSFGGYERETTVLAQVLRRFEREVQHVPEENHH